MHDPIQSKTDLHKSSAVAEMGDRSHNRHGPKRGAGGAVPLSRSAGNPSVAGFDRFYDIFSDWSRAVQAPPPCVEAWCGASRYVAVRCGTLRRVAVR